MRLTCPRVRRPPHRLSALAVKTITTPGWHADGGGLYLEVDPGGRKRWAMRLTVNGKRRDYGIGPIHKVSLEQARETAAIYRAKAYQGIDPGLEKRQARHAKAVVVPTFEECAKMVHTQRKGQWSNGKHVDQWINTLIDYAFPVIGKLPVNLIGTPEVLKVLSPIWIEKPETARRVRQRLSLVLDWAKVAGHRSGDNPVQLIGEALPRHKRSEGQHHAALPYEKVAEFIEKLRNGRSAPITRLAFEFLILTAARTKEVRGALWPEIDIEARTWTIPGDTGTGRRMKSGRTHVVPLSARAIEVLSEARSLSGDSDLVFFDEQTGRMMSENRFLIVRDALGYGRGVCTRHGFRSSFRDWTAEETVFPSEVVEMALAHTIRSKVEAAYRRGHLLAKRRELMEAWARYATGAATAKDQTKEPE